jgi:hypothetical protein
MNKYFAVIITITPSIPLYLKGDGKGESPNF